MRTGTPRQVRAEQQAAVRLLSDKPAPFSLDDAIETLCRASIPEAVFAELIAAQMVLDMDSDVFRQFFPRHAHIETCTHCNARCAFCPVSEHAVNPCTMDHGVFATVVRKLAAAGISKLSLNAYNEPLLDRLFRDRVRLLKEYSLKLVLATNATLLFPDVSKFLAELQAVETITVNLPTVDPTEYRQLMGIPMSRVLLDNLRFAIRCGLPVVFCVNGTYPSTWDQQQRIVAAFTGENAPVQSFTNITHDRANAIKSKHNLVMGHLDGPLRGCERQISTVAVNVEGKVYMCCNDFFQEHVLGDLVKQELADIMLGETATTLRRKTFGAIPSGPDFICRKCVEVCRPDARSPFPACRWSDAAELQQDASRGRSERIEPRVEHNL